MMVNLALARWFLGDSHGARELEEQALAGYRRVLGDDHPSTLRAMDNLAAVRRELGEL
jgi:Tetratricopeptide repeat